MTKIFDVYDDTVTNSENLNMRFKHVQNLRICTNFTHTII